MKKIKISKNREKHIKMFFRFLKENKYFFSFCKKVSRRLDCYNRNIYELIKNGNRQLIYYVIDTIGYSDEDMELDNKWMIFLYENNLYGTSSTGRKDVLLSYIFSIIADNISENKETINKCFEILYKENYRVKDLDELIKKYEKKKTSL